MRALKKVAAAVSLFLASAIAGQSFVDSVDFHGRELHVSKDGDGSVEKYKRDDVEGLEGAENDHKRWVCNADKMKRESDGKLVMPYECEEKFPEDESLPYREFTQVFAYGEGTYTPNSSNADWAGITQTSAIGLIVGFGCTGIFIIFSLVNIIIDEVQRHANFEQRVERAKETLQEDYDVSKDEMDEIEEEFRLKEQKGDQFDAEAERAELAAIN